jgi:hypothetical protein
LFSGIDSRRARLRRGRALLKVLDPARPPALVRPREFQWQYRALRERVHVYSELLDDGAAAASLATHSAIERAEAAVNLSLQYFDDVLAPKSDADDDAGHDDG